MTVPERLTDRRDFRRVFGTARRVVRREVVLFVAPNGRRESRFAVCVPGRSGKAVERNRAKRILKESVRARWDEVRPGLDIVVLVRGRAQDITWSSANVTMGTALAAADCLGGSDGG